MDLILSDAPLEGWFQLLVVGNFTTKMSCLWSLELLLLKHETLLGLCVCPIPERFSSPTDVKSTLIENIPIFFSFLFNCSPSSSSPLSAEDLIQRFNAADFASALALSVETNDGDHEYSKRIVEFLDHLLQKFGEGDRVVASPLCACIFAFVSVSGCALFSCVCE